MKDGKQICVNHVNVRMSISFLVLKLVIADTITALVILLIYGAFIPTGLVNDGSSVNTLLAITLFIVLTLVETALTVYIVLRWLSEFYEISAYGVSHRRGVFFKKVDKYAIQNIKQVQVDQGVFGRIFNFGTLILFDWRLNKTAEMYAVHNPMRYLKILEGLLPNVDQHRSTIREHIIEEED